MGQGGAQTCKKLLPKILRSKLPWRIKMEAWFHLTSCTVYLFMVAMTSAVSGPLVQVHPVPGPLFGGSVRRVAVRDRDVLGQFVYVCCERELSRRGRTA